MSCLYDWTIAWQVRLNPAKCEALNISHKLSPPQFTYTINGGTISWKPLVKYLGIYVNSKLTWSDHCKLTASEATRILNILCRTIYSYIAMFGCSTLAKDVAYMSVVRPCMEYACMCGVESPYLLQGIVPCLMRSKIVLQDGLWRPIGTQKL